MAIDYQSLGKRIRNARTGLGITQERLAEIASLSPSHMSNIETGTTRVSLNTVVRLANVLGVTTDHLLAESVVHARTVLEEDIQAVLEDCDEYEIRVISEIIVAVKKALRRGSRFPDAGWEQAGRDGKSAV